MQLRGAGRASGYEFAKAEIVRVALVGRASERLHQGIEESCECAWVGEDGCVLGVRVRHNIMTSESPSRASSIAGARR